MRSIDWLLVSSLLSLGSCTSSGDDSVSDESDADADSDADTDTDTDTDTTWTVNGLTAWLHPDMASMVHLQWDQSAPSNAHVEYSFDSDGDGAPIWLSSPTELAAKGTNERILVGIPFDTDVQLRLVLEDGKKTVDGPLVTTGPIEIVDEAYPLPLPTLLEYDASQAYAPGKYLMTSINSHNGGWRGGTYWTIVVDRRGRVVWARPTPDAHWTLYVTIDPVTRTHFLWDESTYWSDYDQGNGSQIHRAYLDEEIDTTPTRGLHHEWVMLPDGTLAWGSQSAADSSTEALVELPPGAKESTVIWTCAGDWPGSGGCESNGLYYNPETDSYIYSFYTNSSVVEVDRKSGNSLWWAGTVAGGYDFDPEESKFSWQHGVSITSDGNLLLSTKKYADNPGADQTTIVREYVIDHATDTLHDVWHCDSGAYATTNGDAWRLPNGNTLHVVGSIGQIEEYLPDCTVVWHLDFESNYLLGRGEFVEDLYTLLSPH